MKKNNIYQAIFKTLVYSDVFGSPLNFSEIHRYLFRYKTSSSDLKIALRNASFLQKKGTYYMIRGREKILVDQPAKLRESARKLQIAQDAVSILKKIPTVQLIGVSGSVAVKNANKDADIDLFIITREHTLWITRILVTFAIKLTNKKRTPGAVLAPDTICTNMWMSENNLFLPNKNLFLAREVAQLQVLFDRNDTYNKFLSVNMWVLKYFPNIMVPNKNIVIHRQKPVFVLVRFLNLAAYGVQKMYMKRKLTTEITTLHYAAFHPKDISGVVLQTYANRIRKFSPQKSEIVSASPDIKYFTPGS